MTNIIKCKAVIFDLDGTLVDSIKAVESVWKIFANRYNLDFEKQVLPVCHGRPVIYPFRELILGLSDSELNDVCDEFDKIELSMREPLDEIKGAREFLSKIPKKVWAIATSGAYELASQRLKLANLPKPKVFVTAEMVKKAKPNPDPFLKAMELLKVKPENCIIFEDSKAGLIGAKASGAKVVGMNLSDELRTEVECNFVISDYSNLTCSIEKEWIVLQFN